MQSIEIGQTTRLIVLLGDPVAHSLSPIFQNAAFQAAGVDGVYLSLRASTDDFPGLFLGIARAGGGGNVTLPHKLVAAQLIERRTKEVDSTGACNTFWLEDGVVCGDNTDVAGVRGAVDLLTGSPRGARVLLLGAGGAARAALTALLDDGADSIHLLNRTPARAAEIIEEFSESPHHRSVAPGVLHLVEPGTDLGDEHFDLVINATSLGLREADPLPIDLEALGGCGAALDLVYSPEETRWVREARELGIPAADGIEMLIQQGVVAFGRWWRIDPSVEVMRAALAAATTGLTPPAPTTS